VSSKRTGRSTRLKEAEADSMACEQSDLFIVVMKPVKVGGAKGETSHTIPLKKHLGHWRPIPQK